MSTPSENYDEMFETTDNETEIDDGGNMFFSGNGALSINETFYNENVSISETFDNVSDVGDEITTVTTTATTTTTTTTTTTLTSIIETISYEDKMDNYGDENPGMSNGTIAFLIIILLIIIATFIWCWRKWRPRRCEDLQRLIASTVRERNPLISDVPKEKVVLVIGSSKEGKSSLCNILAGMDHDDNFFVNNDKSTAVKNCMERK